MIDIFTNDARASALRSLLRALVVCATAFGLDLSADQVAAIQVLTEAVIQVGRSWHNR